MPCWHLRPSSGRDIVIQSGDDDSLMNETRKTTTGTRCPTLHCKLEEKQIRVLQYIPLTDDNTIVSPVLRYF